MNRNSLPKGRSSDTYHNKAKKIKNTYRKLFKNSVAQKKYDMSLPEERRPKKKYFCDNYSNEKSFISKFKIKAPSK